MKIRRLTRFINYLQLLHESDTLTYEDYSIDYDSITIRIIKTTSRWVQLQSKELNKLKHLVRAKNYEILIDDSTENQTFVCKLVFFL